jgi:hypothetical protein
VKFLACSRWIDTFSASKLPRVTVLNCLFSAPELPWVMPIGHFLWTAALVHLNCRVKLLNCIISALELLEVPLACTSLICALELLEVPLACTSLICVPELPIVVVLNFSSYCNWTAWSRIPRSSFLNSLVIALELPEVPPTCTSLVSAPELPIIASLNFPR